MEVQGGVGGPTWQHAPFVDLHVASTDGFVAFTLVKVRPAAWAPARGAAPNQQGPAGCRSGRCGARPALPAAARLPQCVHTTAGFPPDWGRIAEWGSSRF